MFESVLSGSSIWYRFSQILIVWAFIPEKFSRSLIEKTLFPSSMANKINNIKTSNGSQNNKQPVRSIVYPNTVENKHKIILYCGYFPRKSAAKM